MRLTRLVAAITVSGLLAGCTTQIQGTARIDPATAPLAVTEDGFGIVAGYDDAPARIEIYTEPQCSHCADLQLDFGEQLAGHIRMGTLQVTYRPLTFLDDDADGYSARVANAMFLATDVVDESAATGVQFQQFVEQLWLDQVPGGSPFTDEELREIAVGSGVPNIVADHIGTGEEAVDVLAMEDTNFSLLFEIDDLETGTPTVYDLDAGEKLDIHDENWLDDLVAS